jgi:preprotein translocase subunit SecY
MSSSIFSPLRPLFDTNLPIQIGQAVVIPILFHSAIAILASILIFPSTISAQYTARLRTVLAQLRTALEQHRTILATSPASPEFDPTRARAAVSAAESALGPLGMSARLLGKDVVLHRCVETLNPESGFVCASLRFALLAVCIALFFAFFLRFLLSRAYGGAINAPACLFCG